MGYGPISNPVGGLASAHQRRKLMSEGEPPLANEALTPAPAEAVAEALHYALRFDERGKPRSKAAREDDRLTADWLVRHLLRSGYVVMQKPPARPHTAGG